jgi:hypothetical protein
MSNNWAFDIPTKARANKSERERRIDLPIKAVYLNFCPKIQKIHSPRPPDFLKNTPMTEIALPALHFLQVLRFPCKEKETI